MPAKVYNIFRGVITQVDMNSEGAEVTVEIAPGIEITSAIAETQRNSFSKVSVKGLAP
ncbi:MAG: hypothetical protein HC769_33985 [Cyanobacteria bacterium CRU_2_1]|nr:hypothetical protein [Cyanobacteria bacterium CRU_2_1]